MIAVIENVDSISNDIGFMTTVLSRRISHGRCNDVQLADHWCLMRETKQYRLYQTCRNSGQRLSVKKQAVRSAL